MDPQVFKTPSRDFGILPFWFWNGDMREGEIKRQLREFNEMGFAGFFIHARHGLQLPYLSQAWFAKVRMACEQAGRLGLKVWIYDEVNWPSGTAGLRIPSENPDFRHRYLQMIVLDTAGPGFEFVEGSDGRYVDLEDSEPISAVAVREEEFNTEATHIIDLSGNLSFGKTIPWDVPPGRWKILYFVERSAGWYIDVLNPEAVSLFIRLTHERYLAEIGAYFGRVVKGFFSDEPAPLYFATGVDQHIIPWSREMLKIFLDRNGYELRPCLPALFINVRGLSARTRLHFWRTVSAQFHDAYFKQVSTWCRRHNVLFTGHLLYEELFRRQIRVTGNLFQQLNAMDIVGVDHLRLTKASPAQPEALLSAKLGSSVAHQKGSSRTLCEFLAGSGWGLTIADMKALADRLLALGVNLFTPHGFHYSIESARKRDWPASQFYHHPWWKHYGCFAEYLTRLSYLLSVGHHVAGIAVLYPVASMWSNFLPGFQTLLARRIEKNVNDLSYLLQRLHLDFDFIFEETLADAAQKNGELLVCEERYNLLILPGVTTLSEPSLAKVEEFFAEGGKIIALDALPVENMDGRNEDVISRVKELFGVDPDAARARFFKGSSRKRTNVSRSGRGGRALFLQGWNLAEIRDQAKLDRLIRACYILDVECRDPAVSYLHRQHQGSHIYFFVNSAENQRAVRIKLPQIAGIPESWNAESGDTEGVLVHQSKKGQTTFLMDMPAHGSRLIVLRPDAIPQSTRFRRASGPAAGGRKSGLIELDGPWKFFTVGDNALLLDKWEVVQETGKGSSFDGRGDRRIEELRRMKFHPGAWELQLPAERQTSYPVTLWYRASFRCRYVPENLRLLVDGMSGFPLFFLNGVQLLETRKSPLDPMMLELPLVFPARPGRNVLEVKLVVSSRGDGILDPVRILGDFALQEEGACQGEYTIAPPAQNLGAGTWTNQGYPFFSGTGVYQKELTLDGTHLRGNVLLAVDCSDDVLEVAVNGRQAGRRCWPPYQVEVSRFLKEGRNLIEVRITNTAVNFLQGIKKPSGLIGKIRLIFYDKNAPCTG